MGIWRSVVEGMRALAKPSARNAEIDEELRAFERASLDEKLRQGMSRDEAQRAVRVETGSGAMVREKVWASGWESLAESVWRDVRFGVRQLVKSPGFSAVAVLSLALGIGANTAIFTIINDLMLKQLPVRDPGSLLSFGDGFWGQIVAASDPGPYDIFPYEFYRRVAQQTQKFDGITAFASFSMPVSVRTGRDAGATQAVSHLVAGNFFDVLGAQPLLGRGLTASDTAVEGGNAVAVISHRYWQQELDADAKVIGRVLKVNGTAFTVVGVMPAGFYGVTLNEETPDMWLPITMQPQVMMGPSLLKPDGLFWIHMMGRRKAGVPVAQEQAWVTAEFQHFLRDREGGALTEKRQKEIAGTFIPLKPGGAGLSNLRAIYEKPLTVLMVMVGVVLLIACANLANLLLARAVGREREFSARLALGSTRGRIVRQILTEALVLALTGGVVGLALAFYATRVLIGFLDGGSAHTPMAATPDPRVLLFTLGVCVLTSLVFGIAPAWQSSRNSAAAALNANARTGTAARRGRILPKALIVAQVTLCLVLLTMAGVLLRTFNNLRTEAVGFDRTNVLLVETNAKFAGYTPDQLNALYDRILERVDALPGVRSASISGVPPMIPGNWGSPIFIDGRPTAPDEDVSTELNRVTAGYFETLGIPVLRGRGIETQDKVDGVRAAVVNQTLAQRYFKDGDALGRTFRVADPGVAGTWRIVGIVRDAKYSNPAEKPRPFAYLAMEQLTGDDRYGYWLQV
ncbi:MAG: ADOP family duplicated permease, partial [Terracidiphilus sp.]